MTAHRGPQARGLLAAAGWARNVVFSVADFRAAHYSRLYLIGDSAGWSLDWDMRELAGVCESLRIEARPAVRYPTPDRQSVFLASSGQIEKVLLRPGRRRVGAAYFHGKPGPAGQWAGDRIAMLARLHERITRIQVTNTAFRDTILNTGISPDKVFLIPIGINLSFFQQQTPDARRAARDAFGIPHTATVVGSFQKDGVGWREGNEPKLVKGPDVLLEMLALLRRRVPDLWVLLSGPARGYVKSGLVRLGIPHRHVLLKDFPEVGRLFHAIDVYVVSSRDEGGPKAVLESMASGVPLVTTRVGQAADLVQHGRNGWMVEVGDAEGLAHWAAYALEHPAGIEDVLTHGRRTAEENCYRAQLPLWRALLTGFVHAADDSSNEQLGLA